MFRLVEPKQKYLNLSNSNNSLQTNSITVDFCVVFPFTAGLETVSVPAYSSSSDSAAKVVGKLLVDAKVS